MVCVIIWLIPASPDHVIYAWSNDPSFKSAVSRSRPTFQSSVIQLVDLVSPVNLRSAGEDSGAAGEEFVLF